jgi:hypothetical protein
MPQFLTLLATIAVLVVQLVTLFAGVAQRRVPGIEVISEEQSDSTTTTVYQISAFHALPWLVGTIGLCILLYGGYDRSGVMFTSTIVIGIASLYNPIPLALTTIVLVIGLIVFRQDFFVFAQSMKQES